MDALPPGDTPRIGWVCNWLVPGLPEKEAKALNFRDTTVAALLRLAPAARIARLHELLRHNGAALRRQIALTAALPPDQRAMRIASHAFPCFTHPAIRPVYDEPALREVVEALFPPAGEAARAARVRLSTHPGQFCVLNSTREDVVRSSIEEVEYHAALFRLLGLAGGWHRQGAHVNIHGGAKGPGIAAFRAGFARLSAEARGLLTVENDEVAFGLDDLLPLADSLPIVLDLHHHWVAAGEYIQPADPRIPAILASWRGMRPMAHVSAPLAALCGGLQGLPDHAALLAAGVSPRELRAHAGTLWNAAHADWARRHLAWTDLEVEAKDKNLASAAFAGG
ncbi:MAG TPA: UV damage endonuclease UvsE [Falsiroseomonas sp.]|jgi:UV DNA damage repair endonuclease|nr:UV damage endonuclease UvsE [Falsiroseomonas sp.]